MTEKRFWYDFEDCTGAKIVDFKEDKEYPLETIGDFRKIEKLLNEQHETIIDNEEYIKDLEYQLKGFKKDYNDCGEYLKEYQQKVKDTLQRHYKILKNQNKVLNNDNGSIGLLEYIADELGIDLQ